MDQKKSWLNFGSMDLNSENRWSSKNMSVCSASYISWKRGTARIRCCARAAAAPAVQQSMDISYQPDPQQQTRLMLLQRADGQTRTDRRTDTVPLHGPCSTYFAGSANKLAKLSHWPGGITWSQTSTGKQTLVGCRQNEALNCFIPFPITRSRMRQTRGTHYATLQGLF